MVVSVLVVYPCDRLADWELWLATAQHHNWVSYCILLVQEKITIQNPKCAFYWMHIDFMLSLKLKNFKLNHHKWGTVCTYYIFKLIMNPAFDSLKFGCVIGYEKGCIRFFPSRFVISLWVMYFQKILSSNWRLKRVERCIRRKGSFNPLVISIFNKSFIVHKDIWLY